MLNRSRLAGAAIAIAMCLAPALAAQDPGWPREITAAKGTITIYQPQPESFKGDVLTGRAAISIVPKGKSQPVFGAMWFTTRVETDRDTRTAVIRDFKVDRVRWPGATEALQAEFSSIVENDFPKDGIAIQLDRLSASLATAEREQKSLEGLRNDPPVIVVSQSLAQLLLFDGEPRALPITGSKFERVANTMLAVIRDPATDTYYLSGGKIWYSARSAKGPWSVISRPPQEIAALVPDTSATPAPRVPPKIIVATVPTELIVTDGAPTWSPVGKGDLLYVKNTETPIVRDVADASVYVLITGRWYRSASLDGPWTFVRPDQLPVAFRSIPPASELGGVRVSVAGTQEAEDALLDAAIPQTAAIKRSSAKLTVTYDGAPQFSAISGTSVAYATNSASQVLRIANRYYAVDNGVWFVADAATGPWLVADRIPDEEIAAIPPSSPVYNVTYVHVYESTPDVVYVGYLPGYLWAFPCYGVPVYGTGFYYPPYWGAIYYPRPVTFGLHVGYNPWTGWHAGFWWSNGFVAGGIRFGGIGGWYGPGGYRPPAACVNCTINIGNSVRAGNRMAVVGGRDNLYVRADNRMRVDDRMSPARATPRVANRKAPGKANDVFVDREGNVYRNTAAGWDMRDGNRWKPSDAGQGRVEQAGRPAPTTRPAPAAKPSTRPAPTTKPATQTTKRPTPTTRAAPSGMDRDASARARGASRAAAAPRPSLGRVRRR